jgi:hypothetical protein
MDTIALEYEQCHCSKINKEVTITSIITEKSDHSAANAAAKRIIEKQEFDCNQKIFCGVFSTFGKSSRVDWSACTHPKLAETTLRNLQ